MAHYSLRPRLQFKLNDFSSTKNIGLPKQPGKMAFELSMQPVINSVTVKSRIHVEINAGMERILYHLLYSIAANANISRIQTLLEQTSVHRKFNKLDMTHC